MYIFHLFFQQIVECLDLFRSSCRKSRVASFLVTRSLKTVFYIFLIVTLPSLLELSANKGNLYPTAGLVVDHLHADVAPVAEIDTSTQRH